MVSELNNNTISARWLHCSNKNGFAEIKKLTELRVEGVSIIKSIKMGLPDDRKNEIEREMQNCKSKLAALEELTVRLKELEKEVKKEGVGK